MTRQEPSRGAEAMTVTPAARNSAIGVRLWRFEYRNDAFLFLAVIVTILLLPNRMPIGVWAQGIVGGAALGIQAIGIVLVYRSNRIINFAQVQVGFTAAALFS